MTSDPLALYLTAGRTLHPWMDAAVAFVWWTAPGVALIGLIYAALTAAAATRRTIRRRRARLLTIRDLERLANGDPRYTHDQPRKETP